MGKSAEEHAVCGKLRRSQLGVTLYKESVVVKGYFKEIGQLLIPIRYDGSGQRYQIGLEFKRSSQYMIGYPDQNRLIGDPHRGFVLKRVSDKYNARFPCCFVKRFPFAIGSNIPVKHKDTHIGLSVFQFKGRYHGMGAADTGAIDTVRFPGSDTLDKDSR